MKYRSFTIYEYRGIQDSVSFDVSKGSIFPFVGVNECGKTTILEALLSFDFTADGQNGGRHLVDVENLYSLKGGNARIGAEIEISNQELQEVFKTLRPKMTQSDQSLARTIFQEDELKEMTYWDRFDLFLEHIDSYLDDHEIEPARKAKLESLKKKLKDREKIKSHEAKFGSISLSSITITRQLSKPGKPYEITTNVELPITVQKKLAKAIVNRLDFILYFDDFRHDVPDRIKIEESENEWTQILQNLFCQADPDLKLESIPVMDPRKRKAALKKAQRFLNQTLTAQWERFHLEDRKSLEIQLSYHEENSPELGLEVMETTEEGDDYFFGIKDRSKGFFWFFNFVMRLEFNPKMEFGDDRIIYLLDEPGSYLHARAQDQLCRKLMDLAENSRVFYCTHSHHLLSPHVIPFNAIRIVEKDEEKRIKISSVFDHKSDIRVDAAFQPVLEALQVKPSAFQLGDKPVVVVEGLYDFLSFDMFGNDDIQVVPAVSADSIKYHLSWLMAWGVDYRALWDHDPEGRKKLQAAKDMFGEGEAEQRFRLLPLPSGKSRRRLENLYTKDDVNLMRAECGLAPNVKFNKAVIATYYSPNRETILDKMSSETKDNFKTVIDSLWS